MEPNPAEHDEVVSQFCAMTGTQPTAALAYLEANQWDMEAAVTEFFTEQDEALQGMNTGGGRQTGDSHASEAAPGGRTLGGQMPTNPVMSSASTSSTKRAAPKKKFATLGDVSGGNDHSLAVQKNPDDLKKSIFEKAQKSRPQRTEEPEERPSHFTGAARTLGGDDAPSRVIDDPTGPVPQRPQRVQRTLHFWADGFSVDDGELYRSDIPRNAEILEGIRQGRAPLAIMNVEAGQEVDVELKQHDEKYAKPKPKYKPFSGAGQRLGSPTPGLQSQASTPSSTTPAPSTSDAKPTHDVDESQPIVTLQIRLGDGTRLTSRFNTTATIGDVYAFVSAATPDGRDRAWVLMTTFPSTELKDMDQVLGDMAEFKRGGVVVQKWT
ncbi:UBX domain-containing protein 1 [Penicillium atrosanguineum]|nr:UBX domain-containing protein 1 [Penicillium atrosanguineum]